MNNIQKTRELGQSIWLDYIRRSFITSGELSRLLDMGVTGVTSNPTIFEKAITQSSDYDASLAALMNEGRSALDIYHELTMEDVGMAADLLRPVFERTGGEDGYVSLEVNPQFARDTAATVREAMWLFTSLGRPNVMIKVPATEEGIPAIEQLIQKGVNVNVTLIFSLQQYREAAQAYIVGLKKRAAEGRPIDTLSSVASFFVSRLDTAVDTILQDAGETALKGRAAIANAKLAYAEFTGIFSGHDWEGLLREGARPQRPLWASTSTKNPSFPDTLYVDGLIGPHTVNTLPMETIQAFLDHGTPTRSLAQGMDGAVKHMEHLDRMGIDMNRVTSGLLASGVKAFAGSFASLIEGIGNKAASLAPPVPVFSASLAGHEGKARASLDSLGRERVMARLWERDHTLWKDEPAQITDRLGWLSSPVNMRDELDRVLHVVKQVLDEGYSSVLLLGMGGSSLAPDLFTRTFGPAPGYPGLATLDSTDPAAVLEHAEGIDPARTLFIVSTKSGTTIETLSLFKYFYSLVTEAVGRDRAGRQFIAVTDPGSPLQELAADHQFRETFLNDPDIGGRYSALSHFGLLPAALMGVDIGLLLDRASAMADSCAAANDPVEGENPGAILGGILGALHQEDVDKLTFIISPPLASLGAWLEQLIAESTGKEGKGIVPVDGEIPARPEIYGKDRIFLYIRLSGDTTLDRMVRALERDGRPVVSLELRDRYDIGAEFFRWEVATAVAGHLMGINPFDQPDVESSKIQARKMLEEFAVSGRLPAADPDLSLGEMDVYCGFEARDLEQAVARFLDLSRAGDYVALQAYVNPTPETALALSELRHVIREKLHVATTVGFGPRYLHSTGQLHKGDGGNGLFIQITVDDPRDLPIPGEPGMDGGTTFGVLKAAQAMGDIQALAEAGRRTIRFHIKGNVVEGIRALKENVG